MRLHSFSIGQAVRLKGGFGMSAKAAETYRITGTLPARDSWPQYRIRSDDERHERVTTEDSLEAIPTAEADMMEEAEELFRRA